MRSQAEVVGRWALLLLAFGIWLRFVVEPAWSAPAYDLSALVVGAKVVEDGHRRDLYDHNDTWYNRADGATFARASEELGFQGVPTPFVHAPLVAMLGRPLAHVAFATAARAWLVGSVVAMLAALVLALRMYAPAWSTARSWPFALLLLIPFEPIRYAFWLGQTTPGVFALTLLGLYLARRGKPLRGGIVLAIPAFLKLTPLVFGAVWLVRRRPRAAMGMALGLAGLTAASVATMGLEAHVQYVMRLREIGAHTLVAYNNHALAAALTRPFEAAVEATQWRSVAQAPIARTCTAVVAAVIGLVTIVFLRGGKGGETETDRETRDDLAEGLGMLAMLLVPSISWTHYFVFLVPVVLIALRRAPRLAANPYLALALALPLFALCMRPVMPDQIAFEAGAGLVEGPTIAAVGFLALFCVLATAVSKPARNDSRDAPEGRVSSWPRSDLKHYAMSSKGSWVVPIALVVALPILMVRAAMSHANGVFTYPLDDAYIHLALARQIASHGVYGVTQFAFTPASSSILWPWLLAAVAKVAGDHLLTPFVLNLALGVAVVAYLAKVFERETPEAGFFARTVSLLAVVLVTPLATLVVIGMEHSLHVLLTLAFVTTATRWLLDPNPKRPTALFVLAGLLAATRYEGLFVVALVALLGLARRRVRESVLTVVCASIPVVAFGLFSKAHGGFFLPNSVLIKARPLAFADLSDVTDFFGGDLGARLHAEGHLLVCTVGCLVLFIWSMRRSGFWSPHTLRLTLAIGATALHVQLAALGWFFRYEAYVVALDVAVAALFLCEVTPSFSRLRDLVRAKPAIALAVAALCFFAAVPLFRRARDAAAFTPGACRNTYEQQLQMAEMLHRYFEDEPVAVNDIGVVSYLRTGPIVDLVGLATTEVAIAKKLKLLEPLTPEHIVGFTKAADIAMIYDDWFVGVVPTTWTRVGQWRVDVCRACGSPVVSIYATRPSAIPRVIAALRAFEPVVPPAVHQEGRYLLHPRAAAPSDAYVLDEGDVLTIDVPFDDPLLARQFSFVSAIGPEGKLAFPYVDPIPVRGRTAESLEAAVQASFDEIKAKHPKVPAQIPHVSLRVIRRRTVQYVVTGNVVAPGVYWSDERPTLASAVERAGGATRRASTTERPYLFREYTDSFRRADDGAPAGGDALVAPLDFVVVP